MLDKLLCNRLLERAALGSQENQMGLLTSAEACDRIEDRLWLQYHSSATPVRPIVHDGMTVMRIASKIVDCDPHDAVLLGSLQDAF